MLLIKQRKHGCSSSPTYRSWSNMIQRCTNVNCPNYHNYGARGISICAPWRHFENFLKDMGMKPTGFSIERLNNNKGYEPSNCIWASPKEQANNRRTNVIIRVNGHKYTVMQFAEKFDIDSAKLYRKLSLLHCHYDPNQLTLF